MTQITEDTFEQVLQIFKESLEIELQEAIFIDPYGMVGILEFGECLKSKGIQKTIHLQLSEKYLRSSYSDVLLEITPIEKPDDIHSIVGKVKERAQSILAKHLHYDERAINGFIVALSEVCQNIIEHSETKGFVGIQKYHFQNMNKNVVKIAVMDIGIGFRMSLSERFSLKNDLEAIEKALIHGASRYAEKGRGHGLSAVRRFVNQWNGKLSIRSGTAKLSIIPEWAWGKEKEIDLVNFPGAQINIMLPEV